MAVRMMMRRTAALQWCCFPPLAPHNSAFLMLRCFHALSSPLDLTA